MSGRSPLLWLPPPLITVLAALMMWLTDTWQAMRALADVGWSFALPTSLAIMVALIGLSLMLISPQTLRRANTTLLAFAPERATALVTTGIFNYSRNPIYVGDALLLVAWALWLGAAMNVLWLALFVLYMSKVQIAAEEQALRHKFGGAYQAYCQQVRRWL